MTPFIQDLQGWLLEIDIQRAERAQRAQLSDAAPSQGGSARCARSARSNTEAQGVAAAWGSEAAAHYLERIGIAADLGVDTSDGSLSDQVARREAERIAACIPVAAWPWTRDRAVIDVVIDSFKDMGGVRYIGLITVPGEGGPP